MGEDKRLKQSAGVGIKRLLGGRVGQSKGTKFKRKKSKTLL